MLENKIKDNLYCVIMSGGSGTRLWPLSNKIKSKQYLKIYGEKSLFEKTYERARNLTKNKIIITTKKGDEEYIISQVKDDNYEIIVEPEIKDTGPSIIRTTIKIRKENKESEILIMPSDHYIEDEEYFKKSIIKSKEKINKNIITYGIKPYKINTNYGYIKKRNKRINNFYKVDKFVEKPNKKKAKKYLKDEKYYWNSGIYLYKSNTLINEIKKYNKEMYKKCKKSLENPKEYNKCEKISIDYALIEKTNKLILYEYDSLWSDLGTWDSLYELNRKDNNNNYIKCENIKTCELYNSYIYNDNDNIKLNIIGYDDLICVITNNKINNNTEILIMNRKYTNLLKNFVKNVNR